VRIISIQLRNYRVYRTLDLEMPGGVVGVYGANGSGKSSLLESIVWALFGKARTQKQQIPTVGETGECSATIEFEHEGHHYRVKRSISGQSFTVKARVWFGDDVAADGPTEVERFMQSVLGMDAASFRASVFAEQKQLAAFSDQAPDKRRQMVLQLLGITPLEKARDRARSEARDLKAQIDRAAPLLTNLTDAEAALLDAEAALAQARLEESNHSHLVDSLNVSFLEADLTVKGLGDARHRDETIRQRGANVRKDLDQIVADLSSVAVDLAAAQDIPEQLATLILAASSLPLLERWHDAASLCRTRVERIRSLPAVVTVDGPPDEEVTRAEQQLHGVLAQKSSSTGELKALQQQLVQAEAVARRSTALDDADQCPTCGQDLGSSVEQMRAHHARDVATAREAVEVLTSTLKRLTETAEASQTSFDALRRSAKRAVDSRAQAASQFGLRALAQTELGESLDTLRRLVAEPHPPAPPSESTGPKLGDTIWMIDVDLVQDDPTGLETLLAATIPLLTDARKAVGKAEGLRAQADSVGRLVARKAELALRQHALEVVRADLLAELRSGGFDRVAFAAAESASKQVGIELEAARRAATTASAAAGRFQGLAEGRRDALREANERHQVLAEQLAEAQLLLKASSLLHDFRQHIVGLIGPQLEVQASSLFNELTNHDYDGLRVDADTYELNIIDHGVAHPTSRFSGSEVDLANLALRVAISEQIRFQAGGQIGLLVLDEALASLDADRKDRTLAALTQLGGRFQQILVVTHSPEVKDQLPSAIEVRRTGSNAVRSSVAAVMELGG
jgi:DNA repair protein SbcC/Rad50